jgi:hypothetical protein
MADEKQCPKCDKEVVCPHCDYCPECEELTYDMTIKCVVCEDEIPIDHGQFCSATCKREYENETDWED